LLLQQLRFLEFYIAKLGRLLIFFAIFGIPFLLPKIFTYFALPKDFVEIRNEDMEGYNAEVFFNAIAVSRRKDG
jgi:hypothetical protein